MMLSVDKKANENDLASNSKQVIQVHCKAMRIHDLLYPEWAYRQDIS